VAQEASSLLVNGEGRTNIEFKISTCLVGSKHKVWQDGGPLTVEGIRRSRYFGFALLTVSIESIWSLNVVFGISAARFSWHWIYSEVRLIEVSCTDQSWMLLRTF